MVYRNESGEGKYLIDGQNPAGAPSNGWVGRRTVEQPNLGRPAPEAPGSGEKALRAFSAPVGGFAERAGPVGAQGPAPLRPAGWVICAPLG